LLTLVSSRKQIQFTNVQSKTAASRKCSYVYHKRKGYIYDKGLSSCVCMEKINDRYPWAANKFRLFDTDGVALMFRPEADTIRGTRRLVHKGNALTAQILDMPGYDYAMAEYTVLCDEDVQLDLVSDDPVLMFFVFLQGDLFTVDNDEQPVERVQRLQWNVLSTTDLRQRIALRKNEPYRVLVIHFELPYLMQWEGTHTLLDRFFFRSYAGLSTLLYTRGHPFASVKMLASIARIAYTDGGEQDYMFREVRVLEVLFQVVQSLFRDMPPRSPELFDADVEKIRRAHAYITDRLDEPITLQSLAYALGINVRKLKEGFRHVYGVTFYSLLTAERMERAAVLLERNHTLREICAVIGYRSSSHFSEAYRKYFGYPPERRRPLE